MITPEDIYAGAKANNADFRRTYLGGSVVGKPCERELWYEFRWANTPEDIDGRLFLLFGAGHDSEDKIAEAIRGTGLTVDAINAETGKQYEVEAHDRHFQLHPDGFISGHLDGIDYDLVWEAKTMNSRNFKAVQSKGVQAFKPMHFAQMQSGMLLFDRNAALYTVECKDNSEIYTETIQFDKPVAEGYMLKAGRIIKAERPPQKINPAPDWYECRFCAARGLCKGDELPLMNCRTCIHSTPIEDGKWHCGKHDGILPTEIQKSGCRGHVFRPELLELGDVVDGDDNFIAYQIPDGPVLVNANNDAAVPTTTQYESHEIAAFGTRTKLLGSLKGEGA